MTLSQRLKFKAVAPQKTVSLEAYLHEWAKEPEYHLNVAGRVVRAIGKPTVIDTSKDERLGRAFSNRTIRTFSCFDGLFGIEDALEEVVRFFEFAAQYLEQEKRILLMKGPPGSGKSTIAKTLMRRAEKEAFWVLGVLDKDGKNATPSPLFESPLGLFDAGEHGAFFESEFKIPASRLHVPMSRWAAMHLAAHGNDLSRFVAMRVEPCLATREGLARIEPTGLQYFNTGDLIGVANKDGDLDRYEYTGAFNRTTQGLLEFVEMSRASNDFLIPFLSATADRCYAGAGNIGVMPYQGTIIAHSNPADVEALSDAVESLGLMDRITTVQIPYCTRVAEETRLYRHYLDDSEYRDIPCVPGVLDIPAWFAVATRLSNDGPLLDTRIRLYDGQSLSDLPDNDKQLTADDLRRGLDPTEGMYGVRTRFVLDALPFAITHDPAESGLDPVSLYDVLRERIVRSKLRLSASVNNDDEEDLPTPEDLFDEVVTPVVERMISNDIRRAYVENLVELSLARLNRYIGYADSYGDGGGHKDPETGDVHEETWLNAELLKMEKGVVSDTIGVKARDDFRREIVRKVLRFRSKGSDAPVWEALEPHVWRSFEEHNILPHKSDKEMLAVISYDKKETAELEKKHVEFLGRLCARGYTARQARRAVEWFIKNVS